VRLKVILTYLCCVVTLVLYNVALDVVTFRLEAGFGSAGTLATGDRCMFCSNAHRFALDSCYLLHL
jgi:hypothetical protein